MNALQWAPTLQHAMSNVKLSELVDATQLTEDPPKSDWIKGPVWKEKGQVYSISSLSDDKLFRAKMKCLVWLGKHGTIISQNDVKLKKAEADMGKCDRSIPQQEGLYFDILAFSTRVAEEIVTRTYRLRAVQRVLADLDVEIDNRKLKTLSFISKVAVLMEEHPNYAEPTS